MGIVLRFVCNSCNSWIAFMLTLEKRSTKHTNYTNALSGSPLFQMTMKNDKCEMINLLSVFPHYVSPILSDIVTPFVH